MSKISDERRQQILEAAAVEFLSRGLEAVSMADIANRAGIGKSTIYEYFQSKSELFSEMCFNKCRQVEEKLREVLQTDLTFREKYLRYSRVLHNILEGIDPRMLLRLFSSAPAADTIVQKGMQMQKAALFDMEQAVRQAQACGEISPQVDPLVAACFLLVLPNPELLEYMKKRGISQPEEKIMNLMLRGLQ